MDRLARRSAGRRRAAVPPLSRPGGQPDGRTLAAASGRVPPWHGRVIPSPVTPARLDCCWSLCILPSSHLKLKRYQRLPWLIRRTGAKKMKNDGTAPLRADLWFERLEMVARGELGSLENSLRHTFHLVQLTPLQFRRSVRPKLDEDSFEALLEAGHLQAAATCLIRYPSSPSLATRHSGAFEAALLCAQCAFRFTSLGSCAGSAALGCWLNYFSRLPNEGWCEPTVHPCLPKARYALRQPLNLH